MALATTSEHKTHGFTLVELIVVLAVLGILLGVATPLISALVDQQRRQTVESELSGIAESLEDYYFDRGHFPTSLTDTSFLAVYLQPGVDQENVKDAWGTISTIASS